MQKRLEQAEAALQVAKLVSTGAAMLRKQAAASMRREAGDANGIMSQGMEVPGFPEAAAVHEDAVPAGRLN